MLLWKLSKEKANTLTFFGSQAKNDLFYSVITLN